MSKGFTTTTGTQDNDFDLFPTEVINTAPTNSVRSGIRMNSSIDVTKEDIA